MFRVRPRPIFLGTDIGRKMPVWLSPDWLKTHVEISGSTGSGKSRLKLHFFAEIIRRQDCSVILINPKGDLCQQARDIAIRRGQSKRLVLFDPATTDPVIGYNPLRPNGLPLTVQAKAVREGIRSAFGQHTFDGTAQLARFLFLALCATRELELTLVEAVQLLRAGSSVRTQMLRRLQNPFVLEALEYFDSLRESRQEELAASTLARLEAFVMDETIRRILTQQAHSLDIGRVIDNREILLVDLQQYRPLRPDDVRLLGRLIVNDVLSRVFSRGAPRSPVFLMIDECQTFVTHDLCVALEQGRELGLHCILSHQHPGHLRAEDPSGLLYAAVTDCARTKIVFGGLSVESLEPIAKELFLGEFDPMKVKDEIKALELDPVESRRLVPTVSLSGNSGISMTHSRTSGTAQTEGEGETTGESDSVGRATISGTAAALLLDSEGTMVGAHDSLQSAETESESHTRSRGYSSHTAKTVSEAVQQGTVTAHGFGWSFGLTYTPFYEYRKRYRVTSRLFQSVEEFLIDCVNRLKRLPLGHFVVKTPTSPPIFVRAPFVRTPFVPKRRIAAALEQIHSRPCYGRPLEIAAEEARRLADLRPPTPLRISAGAHASKAVRYRRKQHDPET